MILGLEVHALDGAPGVFSHRYAGPDATDADRNALLLKNLAGVPLHARLARFVCAIALARPDGVVEHVEGLLPGVIELAPRGTNGFGYDPLFYLLDENATLAELPAERKNQISHRALAARAAREVLERWVAEGRSKLEATVPELPPSSSTTAASTGRRCSRSMSSSSTASTPTS